MPSNWKERRQARPAPVLREPHPKPAMRHRFSDQRGMGKTVASATHMSDQGTVKAQISRIDAVTESAVELERATPNAASTSLMRTTPLVDNASGPGNEFGAGGKPGFEKPVENAKALERSGGRAGTAKPKYAGTLSTRTK